jgi:hypothetical protein
LSNYAEKKKFFYHPISDSPPDSEEFNFEWRNYLYGSLTGVGAIMIAFAVVYLFMFKCSKANKSNEYEMGTYLDDHVAS